MTVTPHEFPPHVIHRIAEDVSKKLAHLPTPVTDELVEAVLNGTSFSSQIDVEYAIQLEAKTYESLSSRLEISPTPQLDIERAIVANRDQREAVITGHERELKLIDSQYKDLDEQRRMLVHGIGPSTLALAKSVIRVRGDVSQSAEGAFREACKRISEGGARLVGEYIGAKRYDRFHQRVTCEYGMAPCHGSIVFAVELTEEVRRRKISDWLTDKEADAALRWLYALEDEARAEGKVVA